MSGSSGLNIPFYTSTPGNLGRSKSPITTTDAAISSSTDHYNEIFMEQSKQNEQMRAQMQQKLDETNGNLEKLQRQFDKYKEEMRTTNKMLNEEIDNYRTNNSDLSMKLALSESKLESALEKCKTMNTVCEKTRRELETGKEKMSKLNEMIIKHEQTINLTTLVY